MHERKSSADFGESRGFICGIDRHVAELKALALDHWAEILVVGNHRGDFEVQFPGVPAPEQIGEAMAEFADHDETLRRALAVRMVHSACSSGATGANPAAKRADRRPSVRVSISIRVKNQPAAGSVYWWTSMRLPPCCGDEIRNEGEQSHAVGQERRRRVVIGEGFDDFGLGQLAFSMTCQCASRTIEKHQNLQCDIS